MWPFLVLSLCYWSNSNGDTCTGTVLRGLCSWLRQINKNISLIYTGAQGRQNQANLQNQISWQEKKTSRDHSWQCWHLGKRFHSKKESSKAAQLRKYPPSEEHCHPAVAAPGLGLTKKQQRFLQLSEYPGFTHTHEQSTSPSEDKLPQTGTKGIPTCFPYALQNRALGRGFLLSPGRGWGSCQAEREHRLSTGIFTRQRQQCHFEEIASVYEM